MDQQTKIEERNGAPESASRSFARGVGDFAHDVLTLTELQAQLLAADVQECRQRMLVPASLLLCGAALTMACFPVALIALAMFLVQYFNTTYATGFLIAFISGAVLGTVLSVAGWRQVGGRLAGLRRSQHELTRNLRWVKKVLDHSRTRGRTSMRTSSASERGGI